MNGEATKASVMEQTRELEATNQKQQEKVEHVFMEKQRKDNQLRQLREQVDKVRVEARYFSSCKNGSLELEIGRLTGGT